MDDARWQPIDRLLDLAIAEDIGQGDATSEALVPADGEAAGIFKAREGGILAGMEIVERLYAKLDSRVVVTRIAQEGARIRANQAVARITGPARAILAGERIALNLLQRMSGVATLTRKYVDAVAGTEARIYDTRKTMPGMRVLDKLSVYIGGGQNHRTGLYDMILIKDNHLQFCWPKCPKGSTACAVTQARKKSSLPIMVEVETLEQLEEAIAVEPDMILLDNLDAETLATAVHTAKKLVVDRNLRRPLLEASGGITLRNVREVAASGVDRISIGALTHSAKALDIGLDFEP